MFSTFADVFCDVCGENNGSYYMKDSEFVVKFNFR